MESAVGTVIIFMCYDVKSSPGEGDRWCPVSCMVPPGCSGIWAIPRGRVWGASGAQAGVPVGVRMSGASTMGYSTVEKYLVPSSSSSLYFSDSELFAKFCLPSLTLSYFIDPVYGQGD